MENYFFVKYLLRILTTFGMFLFFSCNNSEDLGINSELSDNPRLVIENGYYNNIENLNNNEYKCAVEFTYYMKLKECRVGGYLIKWDSTQSGLMNWYSSQTLQPEIKYKITDTLGVEKKIISNPTISMRGYPIDDSSGSFKTFDAEYILQPK